MRMARNQTAGLAALLLALVITAPSAAVAAGSPPGVTVIGEDEHVLAIFKTAKCVKGKRNFHAEATSGSYELDAFVRGFSGFHKYRLALGSLNPDIVFQSRVAGTPAYSNQFSPPFPVPGSGLIKFSSNGRRVGIGFGPAMWSDDSSSAVVLAGGLECRYPRKPRR
jgi:hypothetical protein